MRIAHREDDMVEVIHEANRYTGGSADILAGSRVRPGEWHVAVRYSRIGEEHILRLLHQGNSWRAWSGPNVTHEKGAAAQVLSQG